MRPTNRAIQNGSVTSSLKVQPAARASLPTPGGPSAGDGAEMWAECQGLVGTPTCSLSAYRSRLLSASISLISRSGFAQRRVSEARTVFRSVATSFLARASPIAAG